MDNGEQGVWDCYRQLRPPSLRDTSIVEPIRIVPIPQTAVPHTRTAPGHDQDAVDGESAAQLLRGTFRTTKAIATFGTELATLQMAAKPVRTKLQDWSRNNTVRHAFAGLTRISVSLYCDLDCFGGVW
jgi:hypothetical protein